MKILLDSVILIDRFNGVRQARDYLAEIRGEAVISVVTRSEVLVGFGDEASIREAKRFMDFFPLLEITKPVADLTATLRRTSRPPARDPKHEGLSARKIRFRRHSIYGLNERSPGFSGTSRRAYG